MAPATVANTPQTAALAKRYADAWAAHDPDAIVAMHTEDTVFHMHGVGEPAHGRAAVREKIAGLFADSPDLAFEQQALHLGDDHFATRYVVSGTLYGRQVACDGVDVFTLRDGMIARKDTYLDLAAYLRSLGVPGMARGALHEARLKLRQARS